MEQIYTSEKERVPRIDQIEFVFGEPTGREGELIAASVRDEDEYGPVLMDVYRSKDGKHFKVLSPA